MVCSMGSPSSERDGAGNRSWALADRMTVVTRLHDPLAVRGAPSDHPNVMRPDDHHADTGTRRAAPTRPVARQIEGDTRIASDEAARIPAAPRAGAARAMNMPGAMDDGTVSRKPVVMEAVMLDVVAVETMVSGIGRCGDGKQANE